MAGTAGDTCAVSAARPLLAVLALVGLLAAACATGADVTVVEATPDDRPTATTGDAAGGDDRPTTTTADTAGGNGQDPGGDPSEVDGTGAGTTDADDRDESGIDAGSAAEPGGEGIGDPYFPTLGNGGYDVDRYLLDLEWDPDGRVLAGSATIEATATTHLGSFNLDFEQLTVDTVTVDGTEAAFEHGDDELVVEPSETIAEGASFVTVVSYSGTPGEVDPSFGPVGGGWYDTGSISYVLGEPSSSRAWHPVNDHPRDPARFVLELTVPDPLTVAFNGTLVEERAEAGDRTTFVYETRDAQAPYLTVMAIGDLVPVDGGAAAGVPIRNWFDQPLSVFMQRLLFWFIAGRCLHLSGKFRPGCTS